MTIDRRIFRQADFIEVAVANVMNALRDGGLLVMVIVVLFLANLRAAAITLTAIPLSLAAAVLVLRAFGLSDAEISEIVQTRRAAPYVQVPGKFGGRSLAVTTSTFRVEAEGVVDGRVGARVTAIVQKKAGNPPTITVLEWSGLR